MNKTYADALLATMAGRTAYRLARQWSGVCGRGEASCRTTIYRALRGESILRLDQAADLARLLGVPLESFIPAPLDPAATTHPPRRMRRDPAPLPV